MRVTFVNCGYLFYGVLVDGRDVGHIHGQRLNAKNVLWTAHDDDCNEVGIAETRRKAARWLTGEMGKP